MLSSFAVERAARTQPVVALQPPSLYRKTNDISLFPLSRRLHQIGVTTTKERSRPFGSQAAQRITSQWSLALRPRLTSGLPLSGIGGDMRSRKNRCPGARSFERKQPFDRLRLHWKTSAYRALLHRAFVSLYWKPMSRSVGVKFKKARIQAVFSHRFVGVVWRQQQQLFLVTKRRA